MKSSKKSFKGILFLLTILLAFVTSTALSARDYYQIKVYNIKDSDQEARLDNYLKNAYLPAMHRAGVKKNWSV